MVNGRMRCLERADRNPLPQRLPPHSFVAQGAGLRSVFGLDGDADVFDPLFELGFVGDVFTGDTADHADELFIGDADGSMSESIFAEVVVGADDGCGRGIRIFSASDSDDVWEG